MLSNIPITKKEWDSMDFCSVIFIALALSADASAVSAVCGMNTSKNKFLSATATALLFGLFQAFMPILGWSIGKLGNTIFLPFENILAFSILLFLGVKMLFDAKQQNYPPSVNIKNLLVLAAATSIDALAAGITLPAVINSLSVLSMLQAVSVIGLITFILSFACFSIGSVLHRANPVLAEIFGGIMLILIAFKTLFF